MLISCPNGAEKVKFYPENGYDCFCVGQLKTRLDNNGSNYRIEFKAGDQAPPEIKAIEINKEDLIHLLIR